MIRKALIIGDGRSGGARLFGVALDHRGYRAFLESDAGGAWNSTEILSIQKATTSQQLRAVLNGMARADYAVVVFSGHGFQGTDRRSYICIGDDVDVPDEFLRTGARRQLTIVDACRELITVPSQVIKSERSKFGELIEDSAAHRYRESCRNAFDQVAMLAGEGESLIHSCSPGESAGDTQAGGVFSRSLIAESIAWAERAKEENVATSFLGIDEAFGLAVDVLANARLTQTPAQYLGRRQRHFPFSVA
jgi:hypothetical protein